MLNLHVVQAEYGDCLLLESQKGKNSINVLIDGGPHQIFHKHLKPTLQKLLRNGKLDLIVLSHIDNDHIIGLIDLLEDIKNQRNNGEKDFVIISKLWHNSFNDLLQIDEDPKTFLKNSPLLMCCSTKENQLKMEMLLKSTIMKGFQQATDLSYLARSLKIPINTEFDKLVSVKNVPKIIKCNDIIFSIFGPTKKNLDKLRKEWQDWFKQRDSNQIVELKLQRILDKSIPNLSSILILAESNSKKILFTGDGSSDDIIEMLSRNHMLDEQGRFHVDILKLPHHGSDRNVSAEFFNIIYADYYVISANGRDDNPSIDTLKWIIESFGSSKKFKKIVFTNKTANIIKITKQYDKKKYHYECIFLNPNEDFLTLSL